MMSKEKLKDHLSNIDGSNKTLVVLSFVAGLLFCVSVILVLTLINMVIYKSLLNAIVFGLAAVVGIFLRGMGKYLSNKYVKEIESGCD